MNQFALVFFVAACCLSTLSAHKHKAEVPKYEVSPNVPLLAPGQPLVIRGENAKILFNDNVLYDDSEAFGQGKLRVALGKDNGLYVNHKMVLKQDPSAPVIKINPKLKAKQVVSFEIQVDDKGQVSYVVKTSA